MAELELQFGKDPELRKLAEEMVRVLGKPALEPWARLASADTVPWTL